MVAERIYSECIPHYNELRCVQDAFVSENFQIFDPSQKELFEIEEILWGGVLFQALQSSGRLRATCSLFNVLADSPGKRKAGASGFVELF